MIEGPTTRIQAIREFFGFKDSKEAMAEFKKLSEQDKTELAEGLKKLGYKIEQS